MYKAEKVLADHSGELDKKQAKLIKSDVDYLKKLVCRNDINKMTDIEAGQIKEAYRALKESAAALERYM